MPSKRLRIAIVHYSAPPVTGGVEAVVGAQAHLLSKAGHDVRLIAGKGDAIVVPELDSRNSHVIGVTSSLADGLVEPRYTRLFDQLMTSLEPLLADRDVVAAHNVLTMPMNLPAAEALLACGRPLVAWTHDLAWNDPRYASFRREGRPWSILREAQPAAAYVAVSEARRREMARLFRIPAARIAVVPNGIGSEAQLALAPRTSKLVKRAGLGEADPLILVPQRITPRKRLELAIEAAARLVPRFPALKLVVSGPLGAHSADNAAYFERLDSIRSELGMIDKVIFMHQFQGSDGIHPVSDEDMAGLYRLADAVLLPSSAEGFGLGVLEAGLARTPVVCTDLPVAREVGGGGLYAFKADAGAGQVAAALLQALSSKAARLRRSARAHDWKVILPQVEGALRTAARA